VARSGLPRAVSSPLYHRSREANLSLPHSLGRAGKVYDVTDFLVRSGLWEVDAGDRS
jgi:hypothetical protein